MGAAESLPRESVDDTVLGVEVAENAAQLSALQSDWNALLQNSPSANPFVTWEWMDAWWIHLGGSRALSVVTVRDGRQLVAAAPLSVSRGRLPWLSQLEFLGTGWAGSDYLDIIVRRGYEIECQATLANWLRRHARTVRLDHLPPQSLAGGLAAELAEDGWSTEIAPSGVCPFAILHGQSWESYLDTLRPSQRTRCRRYLNTLNKKFDVSFRLVQDDRERRDVLTALMGFHEQRWGARGGSTAFQTPLLRAFHYDVTGRALKGGWLRLFALRLNDEIAAVTYCFHLNGRFYLYQHGFNHRFCHYSVGHVVLGLTIRAAIDDGAAEFDMLYGDEPYKALWATEMRPLERVELFPPHLRGRLHHRTIDAERTVRMFARRIFPRKPCDSNVPPVGAVS